MLTKRGKIIVFGQETKTYEIRENTNYEECFQDCKDRFSYIRDVIPPSKK